MHSPNPEEGAALAEAVALAKQVGAAIVMGTDPDSDRVGIAVPDGDGFRLLNGNETRRSWWTMCWPNGKPRQTRPPSFVAKTVVTTELLAELAEEYGVEVRETLTGFKFIAEAIRQEEASCSTWPEERELRLPRRGRRARQGCGQSCCLLAELAHELDRAARPCWAVWPPSTSATRRTRKGW